MPSTASIRVVLTGPESTAKSCLAAHLARVFGVPHAPEFARAYLEKHGPAYDLPLLRKLSLAHGASQRRRVPPSAPVGLFDTDLINYKIWCEVVYGRCPPEILRRMEAETTHVYLLCAPDIPWEPDPLREGRGQRRKLFARHRAEIVRLGRPYRIVRGAGPARRSCAEAAFLELTSGFPLPRP
jgi:nicotinamide riboside kinase